MFPAQADPSRAPAPAGADVVGRRRLKKLESEVSWGHRPPNRLRVWRGAHRYPASRPLSPPPSPADALTQRFRPPVQHKTLAVLSAELASLKPGSAIYRQKTGSNVLFLVQGADGKNGVVSEVEARQARLSEEIKAARGALRTAA
ncbi:MAG: hypothetical protein BJ554DRAFT_6708 [Olpidium bornovanus]|uniref:Uncharacterized protein n=1 Tax=Olpidium bornovanus TaxID=278681 RepID=A0A8H7ZXE0_9FUNG|nr:MAG: hypothetical protein BJ554DRAFT_6708 [Olpidium bornovanus]